MYNSSNQNSQRKSIPTSPKDYKSQESDDNEPMSNRDLQRLSNLWRKMKDGKQNLNQSGKTGISQYELSNKSQRENFEKSRNYSQNSSQKDKPGSIIKRVKNKNSDRQQSANSDFKNYQQITQFSPKTESNFKNNHINQQQFEEKQQLNQQNSQLVNKLSNSLEEIDRCHEKISELLRIKQEQDEEITIYKNQIDQLNAINQNQFQDQEQQINNNELLTQEISKKNQEILELQKTFNQIKMQVQENQQQNQEIIEENNLLKQQLNEKQQENDRIRLKLEDVEKSLDEVYLERQTKGSILLEVEYLKNDVERLLTLLKSTKEFKDFANFSDDSGKNIRFLNKMPQKIGTNFKLKTPHCASKINFQIVEKLLWVPTDAFSYLNELKNQYGGQFTDECAEEILLGLNNIWLQREQNMLDREKNKHENEKNSLKNMLNKHIGFNEITSQKQISRLKQQLSKVTQEKDQIKKKQVQPNKDLLFFTDAKRITKEFEEQLGEKQKIIEILEEKILGMQQNSYDKMVYMDGAIWMADKLIQEIEGYKEQIQAFIINFNRQFENLIENNTFSKQSVFETYKPFIDNIDSTLELLLQKFCILREQTFQNISKIQQQNAGI